MIIVVEDRESVASGFVQCFEREGVAATAMTVQDFDSWLQAATNQELGIVEALIVGECDQRCELARKVRVRSSTPLIALTESKSLTDTLDLFASRFDDVVRKPVHVRELLVRASAVRERHGDGHDDSDVGAIKVFLDGRDPIVLGEILPLPRRERRILEYFVMNKGRRVSKTQIYNFVYGLFSDEIDECVIESHISKLRKKLRHRLGFDPIDSQRYLGYCLFDRWSEKSSPGAGLAVNSSFAQSEYISHFGSKIFEGAAE